MSSNSISSDQKATQILIEKLKREAQKIPSNKNKSDSPKSHSPVSKHTRKKPKPKTPTRNYPSLDKWLCKANTKAELTEIIGSNKKKQKVLPNATVKTKNENQNTSKSKTRLIRSPSFEKYGIVLPSYEQILAEKKAYEEHKEAIKYFDNFDDSILQKTFTLEKQEKPKMLLEKELECKHITFDQIRKYFTKHQSKLRKILNKKESQRKVCNTLPTFEDLKCTVSTLVFSQEQKDFMISLMEESFDPEERMMSYFFKVLLPELCFLIFMNVHDMTRSVAEDYLNKLLLKDATNLSL